MIFTIRKGAHRAWPWVLALFFGKRLVRHVVFDISAKYDLPGTEDDEDVNKLFGFGFFPSHHLESARFGWTYNNQENKVELHAYCYVNGVRVMKWLCTIPTYKKVKCSIDIIGDVYSFTVSDARTQSLVYGGRDIAFDHDKKIGYRLGCFFGGNNPAPHTIKIKITKR